MWLNMEINGAQWRPLWTRKLMVGTDKVGDRKAAYICASCSDAAVRNADVFRHSDLLFLFGLMRRAETCSHRSLSFSAHSNTGQPLGLSESHLDFVLHL